MPPLVTGCVCCTGARDVARAGAPEGTSAAGWELVFHKGQRQMSRPLAKAICAGELPHGRPCCRDRPLCEQELQLSCVRGALFKANLG